MHPPRLIVEFVTFFFDKRSRKILLNFFGRTVRTLIWPSNQILKIVPNSYREWLAMPSYTWMKFNYFYLNRTKIVQLCIKISFGDNLTNLSIEQLFYTFFNNCLPWSNSIKFIFYLLKIKNYKMLPLFLKQLLKMVSDYTTLLWFYINLHPVYCASRSLLHEIIKSLMGIF